MYSWKPVLVDVSTQTDGEEVNELRNKIITLQNILQECMARLEEEYAAKIAVLNEENNSLKKAQGMNTKFTPSAAGKEETPTCGEQGQQVANTIPEVFETQRNNEEIIALSYFHLSA